MSKEISTIVDQQVPEFVHDQHKVFVDFLKAYYQWMEQTGNAQERISHIQEYRNIDLTSNDFIESFRREYLAGIPSTTLADKKLLVKRIRDFYQVKGTEAAYEFLFRILFNEDVTFYYPGRDILRTSDGKWQVTQAIRTNGSSTQFSKLISRKITGSVSKATAIVEFATQFIDSISGTVTEYSISNIIGIFQPGENILGTDESGTISFSEQILPCFTAIHITNPGTGYAKGDTFTIKNGDIDSNGQGQEIVSNGKVTSIQNGANMGPIRSYQINEFGIANFSNIVVDFTDSGDGNAQATVITGAVITYPGVWLTTDGFLSSEKKLEDNFYYQDFSYELRSPVSIESYRDLVKTAAHPAGMLFFGKVVSNFSGVAQILSDHSSLGTKSKQLSILLDLKSRPSSKSAGVVSVAAFTSKANTDFFTTFGEVPIIKLWGALNRPVGSNPFFPGLQNYQLNTPLPSPIPGFGPYSTPLSDINIRHLGSNDSNN